MRAWIIGGADNLAMVVAEATPESVEVRFTFCHSVLLELEKGKMYAVGKGIQRERERKKGKEKLRGCGVRSVAGRG
ncbi:MarR family transcriptional regulator [Sesbania bispinosa]|nr:MarR family transcriptional regulator [Sesbania bispinosa]